MKPSTAALRALLGTSQFWMADCYTFTLADGTVVRYASADRDIVDASTWEPIVSDGFLRADTTAGAAGGTTGVGNGWIDVEGGVWRIASGRLQGSCDGIDHNNFARDLLLRPSAEAVRDQRIVLTIPGGSIIAETTQSWAVLRHAGGAFYAVMLASLGATSAQVKIFAVSGTTLNQIGGAIDFTVVAGNDLQLDAAATGSSPTMIAVTVTDLGAGAVLVDNATITDSTAGLQSSGQIGLTASQSFGTINLYSEVATYARATGIVYSAAGPHFERSKVKFARGVEVDELDVVVTAKPTDLLDGAPWFSALRAGILDGAELQLDRAFMASFGDTSAGLVTLFVGRVVEIDVGRTQATIKANTHLELLSLQWPWRLFQPGCTRNLYDAGCQVVQADFGVSATVGSGSTVQSIVTNLAEGVGWASLGMMTFTSGALAGKSYGVRLDDGAGNIQPTTPVPVAPAAGDSVIVYAGCDRQQSTCKTKFNNLQHFEGFPYVPVPETAV